MSTLSLVLKILYNYFLPPFICVLLCILLLASFGKSLGIRRLYVAWLLKIFKFATLVADEARAQKRKLSASEGNFFIGGDDDAAEDESVTNDNVKVLEQKANGTMETIHENHSENDHVRQRRDFMKTMGKESRHNVISRKDSLILSPDQPPTRIEEAIEEENQDSPPAGMPDKEDLSKMSAATLQQEFQLDSVFDYLKTGIGSIIEDEVTQRFVAEELKVWNLLTRTDKQNFEFVSIKLTTIWVLGFFVRYCILLPGRVCILFVGLTYMMAISVVMSVIPSPLSFIKRHIYNWASLTCFRILSRSFSGVIRFHNQQYRPKSDGICVANHTTPIDVVVLSCDRSYALVGQRHGGIFGAIQRTLDRSSNEMIWFERSEVKDRILVAKRLKEHVDDPTKLPILIFPEGTCINNTSVMQFKKGSFEVGGTIYPVAIKYDPIFGDAFWNSSENGMASYIYLMMTSWAIVCDVWYLPPMTRMENEDAVKFANRVKAEIARQGGLVDLVWDGNLKRNAVKSEWKAKQQEAFFKSLKVHSE